MSKQDAYRRSYEHNPYSAPRAPLYSSQQQPAPSDRKGLLVATLCLVFVLAIGASGFGTYVFLKSDIDITASAEKSEMELRYQDKIDRLRTEIERLNSRQIVDRESVEMLVQEIIEKQETISKRHAIVSNLMDRAEKSGITIAAASVVPQSKPAETEMPIDGENPDHLLAIGGEAEPLTDPLKLLGLRGSGNNISTTTDADEKKKPVDNKEAVLNSLMLDLNQMGHDADTALNALAVAAETKTDKILKETRPIGVRIDPQALVGDSVGGPYIPVVSPRFMERVSRAESALLALASVRKEIAKFPLQRPVRKVQVSSKFGARMDPFLKKWALHSGIDFKGATGTPIYAAGAGKVIHAGWKGGYGKMVMIQHPNGLVTRYAHMSRIKVSKGDAVSIGSIIGNIGSTGRSTGPHLHYEVRRGDKALDPANFITVGDRLKKIDPAYSG